MKTAILVLTLYILVGVPIQAQAPEPMITKRWAGGAASPFDAGAVFEPALVPIRLLEIPYERWTTAQQVAAPQKFYTSFWDFVRSQVSREARECLKPFLADYLQNDASSTSTGSLTILKVAQDLPVVILGKVFYEEPAWDMQRQRVATLRYFRVTQVLKNGSPVPIQVDEVLVMALDHGTVEIEGQEFCALASTTGLSNPGDMPNVVESKDFLLVGHLSALGDRQLLTSESRLFRMVGGKAYPPAGVSSYSQQPVLLSTIVDGLQNSGGSK